MVIPRHPRQSNLKDSTSKLRPKVLQNKDGVPDTIRYQVRDFKIEKDGIGSNEGGFVAERCSEEPGVIVKIGIIARPNVDFESPFQLANGMMNRPPGPGNPPESVIKPGMRIGVLGEGEVVPKVILSIKQVKDPSTETLTTLRSLIPKPPKAL